jgi:hypothetical protein
MRSILKRCLGVFRRAGGVERSRTKITLAALPALLAFCVTASAEVLVSRYVVNLDGLRVGGATLRTNLDPKHYKVGVSADLDLFLVSTQIQGEASGTRSDLTLTPEHFQITMSGGDEEAIEFDFANSAEAAADGAVRLRGVFDPLSALLAASLKPSSASNHVCDMVLPIFTGRDRFDLNLRPKPASSSQSEPALVRCEATLSRLLAGGTQPRKLDWEIAFMKAAAPQFWLVERIAVPTSQGIVTIDRADTSFSGP